ncbi:MAG TPA: glycosyltransferase family 4 protein [Gemmataceae bacterium]|jgi:UDP-glucose:(heptosyl)LPS alpha-1,3-glucosyltransferase
MQIAFCHENVLPARGGAEMYVADFLRRLAAEGHGVHLYACRWDAAALPRAVVVHRLDSPRGPRSLRPWRFSAAVRVALDRDRPQVSIGFDKTFGTDIYYPLGGLQPASAAANVRKHHTSLGRVAARIAKLLDPAHRSFARLERRHLLGPNPPLLVVNSRMVRDHAAHHYGIPPERVRVIRNAIDPGRFGEHDRPRVRAEERRRWGVGPGEVVAAFVAMNYHLKGLGPLLHAVARLPAGSPLRLVVAGSPKTGGWQRLAARLGVAARVMFVGPAADVRRVYFAADLHVHPTFYDPCSGVVIEALACGLPVVTSRYNGAAELMHPPREGFVLDDPHDHAALANALAQLLDPVRRDACGRAARQAAAAWTIEHHYRRWLDVFAEVADRRRAA